MKYYSGFRRDQVYLPIFTFRKKLSKLLKQPLSSIKVRNEDNDTADFNWYSNGRIIISFKSAGFAFSFGALPGNCGICIVNNINFTNYLRQYNDEKKKNIYLLFTKAVKDLARKGNYTCILITDVVTSELSSVLLKSGFTVLAHFNNKRTSNDCCIYFTMV